MMQVTVNPAGLTQAQREAVADFILAYPGAECAGSCHAVAEVHDNVELAALDRDSKIPTPPVDLSVAEAGAAFAVLPAPLAPGDMIPASMPAGNAPPPPVAIAPTTSTLGHASSAAPVPPVDFSAALAADAQKLAAFGQSGAAVLPNGVELDKNGLPWDARIHAESKAKIADGSWRRKRGVEDTLVATVEAELRQVMGAPVAVAGVPAAPLAAPIVTTPAPAAPAGASSPTITASPVVAPPPPAPPAPPAADARQVFVQLVGRSAAAMAAGKLTQQEVTDCCTAAGVPMLPLLANRLDLVPGVAAAIDAIIASRP